MRNWVIGAIIVAGVTLTALLSGASSGDAIYIKQGVVVTLSGAQKTAGANFVNAEFPGAVIANVDKLYCGQGHDKNNVYTNTWSCQMCDSRTVSVANYLDLEDAGRARREQVKSIVGGTVTYSDCTTHLVSNFTLLKTFMELWAGTTIDLVVDMQLSRPDPATPSRVDGQVNFITTASPTAYLQDTSAIQRIGRVP